MNIDRQYELVYIAGPDSSEEEIADLHTQVEQIAARFNGRIEKTENWGKRKLAYEIGRHREGVYVLEHLHGTGEMTKEIDRRLKVSDVVIRHLIVRIDEDVQIAERATAERKATQARRRVARGLPAEVDPSERKWSGGLYDQARREWLHPVHATRSFPDADFEKNYLGAWTTEMANAYRHLQWNQYRIECRGSDIKIYLNGVLTTHVKDNKDTQGFIGLQHHGSELLKTTGTTNNIVRFRNLFITELE